MTATHLTVGSPTPIAHSCPFCQSALTIRISDFEKCQQCGKQFNQQTISSAPALAREKIEQQEAGVRRAHYEEPGVAVEHEALRIAEARHDEAKVRK